MAELIRFGYRGIKCDNPNCGWADWSVKQEDYDNWVNRPCPVCGENLLTEECNERSKKILQGFSKLNDLLNRILPEDVKKEAEAHIDDCMVTYGVNADGTLSGEMKGPFPNPEKQHLDIKL